MNISDENIECFFSSTPLVAHSINARGVVEHVSQPWLQLMGYKRAEVIGKKSIDFLTEESRQIAIDNIQKLKKSKDTVIRCEYQFVTKAGDLVDVILVSQAEYEEIGEFKKAIAYITDITKQKKAEGEVKELNQKLTMAMEASKVGIWDLYFLENRLVWDEQMFEVFGLDKKNFHGDYDSWVKTLHPEDRDDVVKHVNKVIEAGENLDSEFRILDKFGNVKYIRAVGMLFRDEKNVAYRMLGMNFDITKEKATQEELIILNEKIKIALHTSKVGIWNWDIKKNLLEWDDQMLNMYGLNRKDFTGAIDSWLETIHPDDNDRAMKQMNLFTSKKETFDTELKIVRQNDSTIRYLRSVGKMLFDRDGKPDQMIGMNFDITSDKVAELNLRMVNERLKIALLASEAGVWDWDVVNDELYWDDRMYEIYGFQKKDKNLLGIDSYFKHVHPDDREVVAEDAERILSGKGMLTSNFRITMPNGTTKYIKGLGKPILDDRGRVHRVIGMNFDVTGDRRSQKALAHALKFAALGEMAGEVAHEINNPLTIIDGYVDKIKRTIPPSNAQNMKDLNKIKTTIQRIASIVKGLRKYTRDSSMDELDIQAVSDIITETIDLTSEKFKSYGVKLDVHMGDDCNIKCRPVEISQMLLNLINNSFDAVKNLQDKWICINVLQKGSDVVIEVIDSGKGIPKEISANILSRFYTTKKLGEGTGMGLSIAKGIVESHGGLLYLDEKSTNTKFVISLPEA